MKTNSVIASSSNVGYLVFVSLLFFLSIGKADELTEIQIRGTSQGYKSVSEADLGITKRIDSKALRSFPTMTLDGYLQTIPGFSLFRRAPSLATHPTGQGVSLRGIGTSGSSRTIVLLDGVPLNDPFGGWINWGRIPPNGLQSIRIQENWGSHHWSFLGLQSVIEMQSSEPGRSAPSLEVAGGTHGTGKVYGSAGSRSEDLSYGLSVEGFRNHGYNVISPASRGEIDVDADSEHLAGTGKVNYLISDELSLYVSNNDFAENRGNGTPLTNNQSRSYTTATGGRMRTASNELLRFNIFHSGGTFNSTFSSQASDRSSETPASDQYYVPSNEYGADVDWSTTNQNNYLELGADSLWRNGESNESFRFLEGTFTSNRRAGGSQTAGGAYLYDRYRFESPMTFDGFIRVNGWQNGDLYRRERAIETESLSRREDQGDRSYHLFAEPRAQLSYHLTEGSTLGASATRGQRIPTLNELSRPFRVKNDLTEANGRLKAETINGYNIDYRYRDRMFSGSIAGFANRIRDAIVNATVDEPDIDRICGFLPEGGVCRQRKNLESVHVYGLETNVELVLSERWKFNAAYLFTRTEVHRAENEVLIGKRLPQVPANHAVLGANFNVGTFGIGVRAKYVDKQFDDDLNTNPLGSFATVDISSQLRLNDTISLFSTAENLFNTRYQVGKTSDGVTTVGPPLMVLAGVRIAF